MSSTLTPNPPSPDPERWRATAVVAGHDLERETRRLARRFLGGEHSALAAALHRNAAAAADGLRDSRGEPGRLEAALAALWRASDLIDLAERCGLIELGEAVELLALGSRVEVPLVEGLRRAGGDPEAVLRAAA